MASRDASLTLETTVQNFDPQTPEIRNWPYYDEIHDKLSLIHCYFPCSLSCMEMGGRAYFKFFFLKGAY